MTTKAIKCRNSIPVRPKKNVYPRFFLNVFDVVFGTQEFRLFFLIFFIYFQFQKDDFYLFDRKTRLI